jgi:hypothetical protein
MSIAVWDPFTAWLWRMPTYFHAPSEVFLDPALATSRVPWSTHKCSMRGKWSTTPSSNRARPQAPAAALVRRPHAWRSLSQLDDRINGVALEYLPPEPNLLKYAPLFVYCDR